MNCYGRFVSTIVLVACSLVVAGCQSGPKFDSDPLKDSNSYSNPPAATSSAPDSTASPVSTTPPAYVAPDSGNVLHVGDSVVFGFTDTPTPVTPVETVVKDDGTVTLIYNQVFAVAGKNVGMLQNEIRERYVPTYYKFLTVAIKTQERFFSVGGQVRVPNRIQYVTKMTLLQAINTAGGFTDFAKKSRVQVTRADKKKITVNCIRAIENPELDIEIYPGDTIYVPKRIW